MGKTIKNIRKELNELHRATYFGGRKISQISGGRQSNPHTASKSGPPMKNRYERPANQYVGQASKGSNGLMSSPIRYGIREAIEKVKKTMTKGDSNTVDVSPTIDSKY